MYVLLNPLASAEIDKLLELKAEVKFSDSTGSRMRVGKNGPDACSVYNYSKWFSWTHAQRETIKSVLPEKQTTQAMQTWFLDIPPKVGFLDVMNKWVDYAHECGKILAYSLSGDQVIWLNGNPIRLKKGEGIGFCLSELHQIKTSPNGQQWVCMMVRNKPADYM